MMDKSGNQLSMAEIELMLIMHKGVAKTTCVFFPLLFYFWMLMGFRMNSHWDSRQVNKLGRTCLHHTQTVRLPS
jgi:hypothetical protein